MIVLKAPTAYRKNKIEGLTSGTNLIRFVKDADGNWIIGKEILKDPVFNHLQSEFLGLEEIEFKPVIQEI